MQAFNLLVTAAMWDHLQPAATLSDFLSLIHYLYLYKYNYPKHIMEARNPTKACNIHTELSCKKDLTRH